MRLAKYSEKEDSELVSLISKDDEAAFDELFERYWEAMVHIAYALMKDSEMSKDCVQGVFVSLWARRHDLKVDNIRAYMFRAVKLKVFEQLRKGKIRQEHLDRMKFVTTINNVEELMAHDELKKKLEEGLSTLPEKSRQVFELRRFEELSNKEISDRLGISLKTVEGHMTKAIKKLRVTFSDFLPVVFLFLPVVQ